MKNDQEYKRLIHEIWDLHHLTCRKQRFHFTDARPFHAYTRIGHRTKCFYTDTTNGVHNLAVRKGKAADDRRKANTNPIRGKGERGNSA